MRYIFSVVLSCIFAFVMSGCCTDCRKEKCCDGKCKDCKCLNCDCQKANEPSKPRDGC